MRFWLLGATLALLPLSLARAEDPAPVFDMSRLPQLDEACQARYRDFLQGNLPRAFAIGMEPRDCGVGTGAANAEAAKEEAIKQCGSYTRMCSVVALGYDITMPHKIARYTPAERPGPITGDGWQLAPDANFLHGGPAASKGVVLFLHEPGLQPNARFARVFPLARPFNNDGWDIWRFDPDPKRDADYAWTQAQLREAMREIRAKGYKSVVLMGHGRGAWQALDLARTPGQVDAVIAGNADLISTDPMLRQRQSIAEKLGRLLGDIPTQPVRLVMLEDGDEHDKGFKDKLAVFTQTLSAKGIAHLALTAGGDLRGHGIGEDEAFNRRQGHCIYKFATGAVNDCPGNTNLP